MDKPAMPRVLIVDDEAAHLRALCEVLRANGYDTQGYSNGVDALAALQTSTFDLLLTDLHMPSMDGIVLLRASLELDPTIVGIIMTGAGSIATAVDAMKSGALDYILKPFKLEAALPVLSRALQVRTLRRENALLEAQVRAQMDELAIANSELEAFSSSVSHDLRAPLQAIEGFSSALARKSADQLDKESLHYLNRIQVGVAHMNDLVEGLLRLARLGRQPLERRQVSVSKLVSDVLEDLRVAKVPDAERVTVDARLPDALADALLLRQVFANLLSNACKFTAHRENPRVRVGYQVQNGKNVYCVQDNGAGFDMAYGQRLFQPFQRLHGSDEFPGLGLGLSIVQRIVKRHGGRIWAEAGVNTGASFYFSLD